MAECADSDVQELADVIADAAMRGIRAGSATLARTIIDTGWRRQQDPAGYLVRVRDNEWQHYRPRDVEVLVRNTTGNADGHGAEQPGPCGHDGCNHRRGHDGRHSWQDGERG